MTTFDCSELCRLCLVKDRVKVPIFEGEGDARQVSFKIGTCLPIKVTREDRFPKQVCEDCINKLDLVYDFWTTTVNSERQLSQWVGDAGDGEDKQGYVSITDELMKQETAENRLMEGSVMNQNDQNTNININMMDQMGLTMPIIISNNQQQQQQQQHQQMTMQGVSGTSSDANQRGNKRHHEEVEASDDEGDIEGLDNDDAVKSEDIDGTSNRPTGHEPTFVSIACDDGAGPSGLQQQKMDMSDMIMTQADVDPKSGSAKSPRAAEDNHALFIFDRESVVLKKWQILEFDGKPYYAFVPENDEPLDPDDLQSISGDDAEEDKDETESSRRKGSSATVKGEYLMTDDENSLQNDESFYDYNFSSQESHNDEPIKPLLLNGITKEQKEGDLYEIKVEGSMITIEKLAENIQTLESDPIPPEADEEARHETLDDVARGEVDELAQEVPVFIKKSSNSTKKGQRTQEETSSHLEKPEEPSEIDQIIEYIGVDPDDEDEEAVDDVEALQNESFETVQEDAEPENRRQTRSQGMSAGTFKCKACSETFGSQIAFRKHVAWTHKKKVCIQEDGAYICAVCDYRTLKKSLFAAHLERKHETWPRKGQNSLVFPCAVCGFVCRSKHSLQSHFIRKHTDKYEHQCKFCPKKFKVKGDLTNHVRFHHKEKPINCDVCGKLCQNTGSLYVHQKWAHYKPKFECPVCKRRMVTQENLDQHMVTQHEKREKIVCAECGKTFTKKDSFKRHMAVHTGSKPHACPICQKPFARQSQLRQHVLIHTGKRPFVCDICGKAFTQKPGLICHRKTHPGQHPPLPVMPIADLVNEFTAEYLQENSGNNGGEGEQEEGEEEEEVGEEGEEEEEEASE